ncbi:cellular tumor antigen p53 [Coccinella septempunctata]|uniref:cellular tumor antigen p53 n=1 Tax=Coccinella septempunctata TaxID=41139 RepID=UPI001D0788B1|nr:cellular tumor antigen p53 [Coccinella septempunctata]XP_044756673.1 cellular tumor antigen p53 [Coccinella septempunctata]
MSFHDSELSDILENDAREALYHNVHDIVEYVQGNFCEPGLSEIGNTFSPLGNEETLNLKQEIFNDLSLPSNVSYQQELPPVYTVPLKVCNEEYAGPYNFDVSIIPNGSKNPWVYSASLNKVFIDMGAHFPVDFRLNSRDLEGLYVRVTPSFSSLQHSQELVFRCVQHEQPQFNKDVPPHVRQHIIRCPSNDKAFYLGDRDNNQRLSVLFPLSYPQAGTDAVREMFVFVCKSSCPTGMNRKPIEIIFTLEKYDGEILGRRILNVRICSCPKRDKEKEEKDSVSKSTAPTGKKRKLEPKDKKIPSGDESKDKNMHSVTIEVPGKANILQILKFSQDLMAGEVMRNPQKNEQYVEAYKKLQAQVNQLQQ